MIMTQFSLTYKMYLLQQTYILQDHKNFKIQQQYGQPYYCYSILKLLWFQLTGFTKKCDWFMLVWILLNKYV